MMNKIHILWSHIHIIRAYIELNSCKILLTTVIHILCQQMVTMTTYNMVNNMNKIIDPIRVRT